MGFYKIWRISWVAEDLLSSLEGFCCFEFVSDCHLVCIHILVIIGINCLGTE
jgi:hypothetical protein